jgi:hypothetical protein
VVRLSLAVSAFCRLLLLALIALAPPLACAETGEQWRRHDRRPVYQRRAFESSRWHGKQRHRGHNDFQYVAPQVSASWFQRPYPYHLDYYRMKYGGSYAPYFGNLYGPPQVVTAPPYYGPYYGGYGEPGAYGSGDVYNGLAVPGGPNPTLDSAPMEEDEPLPGP